MSQVIVCKCQATRHPQRNDLEVRASLVGLQDGPPPSRRIFWSKTLQKIGSALNGRSAYYILNDDDGGDSIPWWDQAGTKACGDRVAAAFGVDAPGRFRRAGYQAIDRICEYYYALQDRPVTARVEPGRELVLTDTVPDPGTAEAPQTSESFDLIAQDYETYIMPGTGEAVPHSILVHISYSWSASPACTELETVVMDWAAKMLGLDSTFHNSANVGGGVIQTTASDSALVAVVAARSRYTKQHRGVPSEKLLIYTTTQTHSLGRKAGLVLGLNIRALEVAAQDNFALRGDTLRRALEEDRAAGLHPFIMIGTVGTTSSGAVDCLGEIGLVLTQISDSSNIMGCRNCRSRTQRKAVSPPPKRRKLERPAPKPILGSADTEEVDDWIAMVCPEYRDVCALGDINKYGDSFCTNFHKWGLVNFDCSGFWVRDRASLIDALDVTPEFLRTKHGDAGGVLYFLCTSFSHTTQGTVIDYRNWHFGLGRKFRSLKLWFVLRSFGVEGFQRYIRETVKLGNMFASLIRESTEFALVTPPSLALTVFRLEPRASPPVPLAKLNELNRVFYARVSARSDIAFTQTDLSGTFCVRMAVGATRTSEDHVKHAYEILCLEGKAALEEWQCATGEVQ
ncbi:pyridoxal phosphate-dependent transferase [Pisolithus tinctorius]|nr:pyridoxal phosphate-dependent transferase [Pisolithus tinctorius]